jgi:hypothetical protein
MNDRDMAAFFLLLETFAPASSLANKLAVLRKNPHCFTIIEKKENGGMRVVGYFVAYRLTRSATNRLKSGELSGKSINPKDIVAAARRPYGLYVSFLWGETSRAKGEALLVAKTAIRTLLSKGSSLPVFARIATKDSLRLLTKYGFTSLNSQNLQVDAIAYRELAMRDLQSD